MAIPRLKLYIKDKGDEEREINDKERESSICSEYIATDRRRERERESEGPFIREAHLIVLGH